MIESSDLQECFSEVRNSVNAAMGHYQIWFTLKSKAIEEHYNDMNDYRYVDFFFAANLAHYNSMFIEIGCIFDTDTQTNRIRRLKKAMEDNGLSDLSKEFESKLSPFNGLVSNILTVRSKLIAHKESGVDPSELYAKHGIKPNSIRDLLNIIAELMYELEQLLNGGQNYSNIGVTDRWEKATYNLLNVIRNGRHS